MIKDRTFTTKLLKWYDDNKRELPWRNITDPYKIWLSEVILQQTRVNQGKPYYLKFIDQYPTIHELSAANESHVLRTWQGLGYYSRARNLHRCAKEVVEKHDGVFPNNFDKLIKLPGVGPYTAAAIVSFAFKEKVAVVDGNVYRVLARVFGIETDISSSNAYKLFKQKAEDLIDSQNPDQFNQAIMEFGATACVPKNPDCEHCIYKEDCFAYKNNLQDKLPVKEKKVKTRKRFFNYIVLRFEDNLFLNQRRSKDIWQNMYDFPLMETSKQLDMDELTNLELIKQNKSFVNSLDISEGYKHVLSHQIIYARFILVEVKEKIEPFHGCWFDYSEILELPKPVLISTYLRGYIF